jgi:biotin carboxyl carrier protein
MAEGDPLHDARALLRGFTHSSLRSLDVRGEDLSLFLSRDATIRRSPDAGAPAPEQAAPDTASGPPPADLPAPHLGTLASLLPVGARVAAGDVVARLIVLDRETALVAPTDAIVFAHHHAVGTLVEYGQPVIALA